MTAPIDLGHGHTLGWRAWQPDHTLSDCPDVPPIPRYGARIIHTTPAGEPCSASVTFDTPEAHTLAAHEGFTPTLWQVEAWEPLTLSPSLLCGRCGDHGFIRAGKWVPA